MRAKKVKAFLLRKTMFFVNAENICTWIFKYTVNIKTRLITIFTHGLRIRQR